MHRVRSTHPEPLQPQVYAVSDHQHVFLHPAAPRGNKVKHSLIIWENQRAKRGDPTHTESRFVVIVSPTRVWSVT